MSRLIKFLVLFLMTELKSTKRTVALLDTESLDTQHRIPAMSEACLLIVQYDIITKKWKLCDEYSTLILPPLASFEDAASFDESRAFYVYQHVTGLSFDRLRENGIPFLLACKKVMELCEKWKVEKIWCRDIGLEKRFFKSLNVSEICDVLQSPMKYDYKYKSGRPANEYEKCFACCTCGNHQYVYPTIESATTADTKETKETKETYIFSDVSTYPGSNSISDLVRLMKYPHCARVDCYVMLGWLQAHFDEKQL